MKPTTDPARRLAELERVRAVLAPDADDARVGSELTAVEAEIRAIRRELSPHAEAA